MSRIAITLKFKMRWFPDEASYWAEKLQTDVNFPRLKPDVDKNFDGSLVLDFGKWWRHMQAKNIVLPSVWRKRYDSVNFESVLTGFPTILPWLLQISLTWARDAIEN